ncbi:MAG: hypothetical protein Q8R28_11765 [Dehalococcoidia bacterium]|nr:hypothetical protein [Dehalococcoidia bacterium]
MENKLDISLKNLREVEAWLQGMFEEVEGGGHVHVIESRLRDTLFLLRHAIDQIDEWKKAGKG